MSGIVVLMGGGNIHGRMVVEELIRGGSSPRAVINEVGSSRAARLEKFLCNDIDNPPSLESLDVEVIEVAAFDSESTLEKIRSFSPRYLINGGCGIFRAPLLNVATPLNIHPGLLPFFRGLDPVLWSVMHKRPVGATVHVMSEGVDEGPILLAQALPWVGATSLLDLRLQCMRWGARLLTRFLACPGDFLPRPQCIEDGQYYSAFPDELIPDAERILRGYRACDAGNIWVS